MRNVFIFILSLMAVCSAVGATQETFDITSYTPPSGWKKELKEGVVVYSTTTESGSYCIIGIYKSKQSSGNVQTDFDADWKEVIVKPFQVSDPPQMEKIQELNGWKILLGASSFTTEGATSAVLLSTYSGHGRTASSFMILNDQSYMSVIEKFLDSVDLRVEQPKSVVNQSNPIIGIWSKSASSPWGTSPGEVSTYAGYYKGQYQFHTNGSYNFKGESWGGYLRSEEFWTIEEKGSYSITDYTLVITPSSCTATRRNGSGAVQESRNQELEKIAYKWNLHYFEGINETNLILQPSQPTMRDGGYSGNSNFPNSYLYSQDNTIEWRF